MAPDFRPHQPGLRKLLGDLEAAIMVVVWDRPEGTRLTVREVHEALRESRDPAYTTVMTVMGNLAKKGVLAVEKAGVAYHYYAPLTREAFTEHAVGEVVSGLLDDFAAPAMAHFAKALDGEGDAALLARLRGMIEGARKGPQA